MMLTKKTLHQMCVVFDCTEGEETSYCSDCPFDESNLGKWAPDIKITLKSSLIP